MVLLKRNKLFTHDLPPAVEQLRPQWAREMLDPNNPARDDYVDYEAIVASLPPSAAPGTDAAPSVVAAAAADKPAADVKQEQPEGSAAADEGDKKPAPDALTLQTEVYLYEPTGEIFLTYEEYARRALFYQQKVFQCEVTGHSNLTYRQAVYSEQQEAIRLHDTFPAALKGPLLRAVQFQLIGRMDRLVDVVHDRFCNRFYDAERLFVDINGGKYHAQITHTFCPPPRQITPEPLSSPTKPGGSPSSRSTLSLSPPPSVHPPHAIGANLALTQEEADRRDDPKKYRYSIVLVDQYGRIVGKDGASETEGGATGRMDVSVDQLSRDRTAFSKSILKRFLRDCLDRDATSATSPWVVKPALAAKYDIPTDISAAFQNKIDDLKEAASRKRRRKPLEDELDLADEATERDEQPELGEDGQPLPKKRKRRTKAELIAAANGGVMPDTGLPPTPERKKPVKYPAEDFLCSLSAKEIKEGKAIKRPLPHGVLPFGEHFETFIMTWNFLNSFGSKPLVLSPFSLDDYESALLYAQADPVHPLTVEIHATLLNLISRDPVTRPIRTFAPGWDAAAATGDGQQAQVASGSGTAALTLDDDAMEGRSDAGDHAAAGAAVADGESEWKGPHGLTEVKVVTQAQEVARKATWMMGGELKHKEGRRRWESWLVGCIVDRADNNSFPKHLDYLAELLYTDEEDDEDEAPSWTVTDSPVHESGPRPALPSTRYHLLKPAARLEIIAFLCDLAMQTKSAREAMDESMAQLTEVRKEMQDVKRDRRKVAEERLLLDPTAEKPEGEGAVPPPPHPPSSVNGDSVMDGMSVDGDAASTTKRANGNGHAPTVPGGGDDDSELSGLSGDEDDDDRASRAGPAKSEHDDNASELADESRLESEIDDMSETASVSSARPSRAPAPGGGGGARGIRQQALKAQQQAKEAEAAARAARIAETKAEARSRTASAKQLSQERRRLEDEDQRLAKREEALQRDFRKQYNMPRARPLGLDRFGNKVWWFDGMGSAPLIGPGGVVLYGSGRLFLQGGDPKTRQYWMQKHRFREDEILKRRLQEEGEDGMLAEGQWVCYEDPAEITAFLNWLNVKGNRESKLIDILRRWWDYIHKGAEKRWHDVQMRHQQQHAAAEQRRSTRGGQAPELGRHQASLQWRNKKADPGPR